MNFIWWINYKGHTNGCDKTNSRANVGTLLKYA